MKKSITKSFVLLIVLLGSLTVKAAPQTVIPQRQNEWWMARHEQKLQEVCQHKDEINLVFIGDSITHYMDDRAPGLVQRTFPGMISLNLGFSADKTENVLWRLRNGELDGLSPKLVIIMIGTNNTGHRKDPADVTVQGIELIIKEVRQHLPGTKVLLLSIFPRGATAEDPLRILNEEINQRLPALADNQTVFHLDINKAFLDEQGNLSTTIMPDLLHPNAAGYDLWMTAMKPVVEKILSDKSACGERP